MDEGNRIIIKAVIGLLESTLEETMSNSAADDIVASSVSVLKILLGEQSKSKKKKGQ